MKKDCREVWGRCLAVIKDNITVDAYKAWFEPIKPLKLENNILTIQVPSQFFYEWLEEHYIGLLKKTVKHELGSDGGLAYNVIIDQHTGGSNSLTVNMPTNNKTSILNPLVSMPLRIDNKDGKEIPNPFIIPGLKKVQINSQLKSSYTFDNFVEGDCNRLARSAGYAIAKNPGKTAFNPFFVYSATGLGKTHLAHAIGIQAKLEHPDKTVLYVTADQFYKQFVESVRNSNQNDFVHFYQMIDVLLIDDIHSLASKEKTQDIFFHIFNHLHQNGNQIIITSDKPPIELKGIEPRLLSRFKWGLAADIQLPDFETRLAILYKKLYKDGIEMPEDVVNYIAYSITTSVRELEGALISIMAQSSLNRKAINIDLAKQVIDNYIKTTTHEVTIDLIQTIVSTQFNIPIEDMMSLSRKREIAQARQLAMYLSKKLTKIPLAAIGVYNGNRDHSTVLHACKTISNLLETDKEFRRKVEFIESKLSH